MTAVLAGVLPVFALIALGYALRRGGLLAPEGWSAVERLTYFVFYPGFLIPAIWAAEFGGSAGALGLATVGTVVGLALAGLALRPWLPVDGPGFTSVFQGLIRWNSFVFLPLVALLFGEAALGVAAVLLGALVPVVNVASVLVLSRWGAGQGAGWRAALSSLVRNPILLSCAAGLILNGLDAPRPAAVAGGLGLLSAGALPLGLIVAGAGLRFKTVKARPRIVAGVSVVKLLLTPLLMWSACRWLGGDALAQGLAVVCGSAPGAAASYVVARQMGGDASLMAAIVAVTTVASVVTIPLVLALAGLP